MAGKTRCVRRVGVVLVASAAILAAEAGAATAGADRPIGRGSVEQAQLLEAAPGKRAKLEFRGRRVDAERVNRFGAALFRDVEPGAGYAIRVAGRRTDRFRVFGSRARPRESSIYEQRLGEGFGYLRTRDRTKLAINVVLPGPPEKGPYPTVVEYSGYGYADPAGPESGIGPIAGLLGYAVVEVNMRGTGCSGGSFDYFERLQSLDGYDVIETVATQPWVLHGEVGMIGVSYGGISQLFVGSTRPPSLAAVAPLSVIDDTLTTLYPGGILNTGFALEWAEDRVEDAKPAGPNRGQGWAWKRIQEGDEICKANQALHAEAVNLIAKTRRNNYYRPKVADPLAPRTFVDRIEVPTFLACQWTDEQTGGHCPALVRNFTGTDRAWFTFTNGTHTDSLDPETFNRWFDFLELYVARRKPDLPPAIAAGAPALYASVMGVQGVSLPADPIRAEPDFASALAAFEAQRPVRVLFDNGAGAGPGKPLPGFERSFTDLPAPRTDNRSWYLRNRGRMKRRPGRPGAEKFRWNPAARPPTNFNGDTGSGAGGLWTDSPRYEWSQSPRGRALSYLTPRLGRDTAVLGAGELQLWLRSAARNVDLQATVTEVRPDRRETYVQSGWLRTGARKLDRQRSRLTEPVPTYRKRDRRTLPRGRWVKVRIPLYYEGHVYRKGSRIRVTISAPGGDQPIWAFAESSPSGTPWVAVRHSRRHRSRLVLPVLPGLGAPTELPPCPGLRGQPCRDFEPFANRRFGGR